MFFYFRVFGRRLFFMAVFLCSFCIFANNFYARLDGGYGFSQLGTTQQVRLDNSPSPGLVNKYVPNDTWQHPFSFALSGGYNASFEQVPGFNFDFGGVAEYVRYGKSSGVKYPFFNAGNFDPLNDSFKTDSYMILGESRINKPITGGIVPFVSVSVGLSVNKLNGYGESAPVGSSGVPATNGFRERSTTAIAFGVGVGVKKDFGPVYAEIGYRYIDAGSGKFKQTAKQQTSNVLTSGSMASNMIYIGIGFNPESAFNSLQQDLTA